MTQTIPKQELLQAGKENVSTRAVVEGYKPKKIPHDEVLDPDLLLKLLHIAAWTGDVDTIRELKTQKLADPAAQTAGRFTALHLAASRGYSDALGELLSWPGLDAQGATSAASFTPLHLAAYGGHTKCVERLLDVSDVNAKDEEFGRSALHFAAQGGHDGVVDLLTRVRHINVRSKDAVRDLTPFLLAAMQPKGRCSLRLVKTLLDANVEQINDKVGILTHDVGQFVTESWRLLTAIETDNSMKPTPGVDDDVDEAEEDLYRKFAVPVEGHTALHLAATQNNAELVSHLVSRTGVLLNEGDTQFGMTPLHCAIRTEAMDAFSTLMSIDKLNVSATLVEGGSCQRPYWLPPVREFTDFVEEKNLLEFREFTPCDTPLHLAVRICPAKSLPRMVIDFCNHPTFNPAIHNREGFLPLELAWIRLDYCPELPSLLRIRKGVQTNPQRSQSEIYQYEDRIDLNRVINLLKRHPSNASRMSEVEGMRKAAQDSVNAFLVTATLLAGLTFSAYLQPPFGANIGEYKSKPARSFWIFNSVAFYFAVYTILRCLLHIIRSDRLSDEFAESSAYVATIRIQSAVPLTVSVGFGMAAFVAAGYGNLPPESKSLMFFCTISGLLLVGFQLVRNLDVALSTLKNAILDVKNLTRDHYISFWSKYFWGSLITLPVMNVSYIETQYGIRSHRISPLKEKKYHNSKMTIAFVGTQLFGAVVMCMYALIVLLA